MYHLFYFMFYFTCTILQICFCAPQCLDENGNPVDWYVLYKLPKLKYHEDRKISKGIAYAFITSETIKQGWQLSHFNILDSKSFPGRTISSVLSSENQDEINDYFWILYNDKPPFIPGSEDEGHTKGIVAGNDEGGFWLVHSVPNFPITNKTTYEYPKSGTIYGQSFLCISFNPSTLDAVGDQLITNCANVFNSSMSSKLEAMYPSLAKAAKKERRQLTQHKEILHSIGNNQFVSFAKSEKFKADLYSDWVSSVLRSKLFVETWLHDDALPSACNKTYPVYNVQVISMNSTECKFKNGLDHSKYAVSAPNEGAFWVCVGDINRAKSQFVRGGGTVCMNNEDLWSAYSGLISSVEPCM